jgi:DNA-binding NtrC family response regulator
LFGHVKGAFTDAHSEQKGLVHEASGGTLFLDEINTLSSIAQIKILRFIEDRRYKPLGSAKYVDAEVRIIAATNVDLKHEVEGDRFRRDLYYRIKVLSIVLPPLRERFGDIPLLSDHYLNKFSKLYDRGKMYFTAEAVKALCSRDWPGNVRELKNLIEKTVIMSLSNIIRADVIQIDADDEADVPCLKSFQEAKRIAIEEFEKMYLRDILVANRWNVSKAARQAEKDRRTFQRLIRKHGLSGAV